MTGPPTEAPPDPPAEDQPQPQARGASLPAGLRWLGSPWGERWAALVVCVFVGLWVYRLLLPHLATRTSAGGLGDSALLIWWLKWDAYAVLNGHNVFYTHLLNAPSGLSAMWNTSMVAVGVVFLPVTAAFGVVVTYNLSWIAGPVLSAWTCAIWLRRHVRRVPALLGGLLFGFSPYTNLHLFQAWLVLIPVIVMLVEDVAWRSKRPWLVAAPLLGLTLAVQMLVSSELLLIICLGMAFAVVVAAVSRPVAAWRRLRPAGLGAVVTLGVTAVLLAYPVANQFSPAHVVHGAFHPVNYYETRLSDLVNAPKSVLLHTTRTAAAAVAYTVENGAYVGFPLLLALAMTCLLVRRRRWLVVLAAVTGIVFFGLSFGGRLRASPTTRALRGPLLPWGYLENHFSLLVNVVPARITLVSWLAVVLIGAIGLDAAMGWSRRQWWRGLIVGVAVVVCLGPLVPAARKLPSPVVATPRFFTSSDVRRELPRHAIVLVAPVPSSRDARAMIWQVKADLWFAQVGGYSLRPVGRDQSAFADAPGDLRELLGVKPDGKVWSGKIPRTLRLQALAELRATGATAILVGRSPYWANLTRTVERLLGRKPSVTIGGVRIWRLRRPAAKLVGARTVARRRRAGIRD